jgi:hypothetical protein
MTGTKEIKKVAEARARKRKRAMAQLKVSYLLSIHSSSSRQVDGRLGCQKESQCECREFRTIG